MFDPIYKLIVTANGEQVVNPEFLPEGTITACRLERRANEHATPYDMDAGKASDLNRDFLANLFTHYGDKPADLALGLIRWLELESFEQEQLDAILYASGYNPADLLDPHELLAENEDRVIGDPEDYALEALITEVLDCVNRSDAESLILALTDRLDRAEWLQEYHEVSVHVNGLGVHN